MVTNISAIKSDAGYRERQLISQMVNSTFIFIFAYLLTYLGFQIITLGTAMIIGIKGYLYYNEIFFQPEALWSVRSIILVTSTGPLLALITGIMILVYFSRNRKHLKPLTKLLLTWSGFHFINFFAGGIISGTITGLGLGYALDLILQRPIVIYFILDLMTLSLIIIFGYKSARLFLKSSPSNYWTQKDNQKEYLFFSGLLPLFLGSLVIFLFKYPDHTPQHDLILFHDMILLVTIGCMIIAMLFKKIKTNIHIKISRKERGRTINWNLFWVTIILLFLCRIILTRSFYSIFA